MPLLRPKSPPPSPRGSGSLKRPRGSDAGTGPAYRRSGRQEKETAAFVARTIKGSGRFAEKGDVRAPSFVRVECKCTAASSYRVTSDTLDKLTNAAACAGELPYLEVELGVTDKGAASHRFAVVPMFVLEAILMHHHELQKSTRKA